MAYSSGKSRADAIDNLVDSMQKGKPAAPQDQPKLGQKTAWELAGMTREEWQAGQAELDLERMRKNQSHPGNQ